VRVLVSSRENLNSQKSPPPPPPPPRHSNFPVIFLNSPAIEFKFSSIIQIFLVQLLDLWDKWSGCKATEGEFGVEVYHYYFELEPSANQHNQKQKENSLFFTGGSRDPKNDWWPTRSSLVAPGVFSDSSCSRWLLR
jgi:hypothetical protein